MVLRRAQPEVPAGGRQGAPVLSPAAWEAWGRGSSDAKGDRTADGPERPIALKRGALPRETVSTRAHILDTAERHFAEHGFADATVRNIAVDAGLKNQAGLYHHFRDKRALYEAALARGVEPIISLLRESIEAAPPPGTGAAAGRRAVDTIIDRLFDYLVDHPHLPRLLQRAALDDSRHLRETIPQLLAPVYEAGLRALAGTGTRWRAEDLPHLAFGIYHLIFAYFANTALLEVLLPADPRGREGVARQRRFVKAAVAQLLGVQPET
jgi:AcrR family transcriptional regulator